NMIVQVRNTNNVAVPKITIALSSPEDKRELVFYQVGAGRSISIPIEKKPNELPPAVNAKVRISMAANEYIDITDKLNVNIEKGETEALLTVHNGAEQACATLNITVKFVNGADIVYAQMQELQAPIEPGESTVLTFSLPEELKEEGITFDRVEYAFNQAVAQKSE
ncbi:MAG: hypothetical protein VB081_13655, partial [Christensenella sp.]|uniref:hypothetical protein n=1 Tax=Christensenella sp. TaxID=1935934 RepID=UPI002B21371F